MTATLTICETCGYSKDEKIRDGKTAGEVLGDLALAMAQDGPVEVRRHPCLMGCDHPCNVSLQAPGKISYVLGGFDPTPENAEALLEYSAKFAASETGQVPYREWPQLVKGHFIARIPPAGD